MKIKSPFLLSIVISIMLLFLHTSAVSVEMKAKGEYRSPEGILYQSYSSEWAQASKLRSLHLELLKNSYGEEIKALKRIAIYPEFLDGNRTQLGSYKMSYQLHNGTYTIMPDNEIILYGGNDINTIDEIAGTLATQYGKHFTQYHITKNENMLLSEHGSKTSYAEIRQLTNKSNSSSLLSNIENLAANDYVQLFGSALARKHYAFPNMIDEFEKNPTTWVQPITAKYMYNLLPQENDDIPLAFEVKGLRNYFISLAKMNIQNNTREIIKPYLYIDQIQRINNQSNSLQISFAWETIAAPNQKLNYTLVAYGEFDSHPYPIITYQNNDTSNVRLLGRFGTVDARFNNVIYFNKHLGFYGKKIFRVFASDGNGNIVSSNEIKMDLSVSPIEIIDNNVLAIDINANHWSFHDFKIANGYRFIRGYPDHTIRPNVLVTRAELLTIFNRVNQFATPLKSSTPAKQTVSGSHWATPILNEAIQQNFVKREHYGKEYELFHFNETMSREEVAMLAAQILRNKGFSKLPNERNYIDIQNSKYKNDILLISSYNIVQGFPDQSFRPNESITRAQATVIANQLFRQIRAY